MLPAACGVNLAGFSRMAHLAIGLDSCWQFASLAVTGNLKTEGARTQRALVRGTAKRLLHETRQAAPDGARARSVRVNGLGKLAVFGLARSRSYANCSLCFFRRYFILAPTVWPETISSSTRVRPRKSPAHEIDAARIARRQFRHGLEKMKRNVVVMVHHGLIPNPVQQRH